MTESKFCQACEEIGEFLIKERAQMLEVQSKMRGCLTDKWVGNKHELEKFCTQLEEMTKERDRLLSNLDMYRRELSAARATSAKYRGALEKISKRHYNALIDHEPLTVLELNIIADKAIASDPGEDLIEIRNAIEVIEWAYRTTEDTHYKLSNELHSSLEALRARFGDLK